MPDEGTAVLEEPDTASPETDTAAEAPETEVFEVEPETGDAPTTPDSDTEGETTDEPLSREEHEKILKAEKAKLEESFRRKEENARKEAEEKATAAEREATRKRAEGVVGGQAYQHLAQTVAAVQKVVSDGEQLNPQFVTSRLQELAQSLSWAHAEREMDAHWSAFKELAKPEADSAADFERSRGRQDIRGMVKALHEAHIAAAMPEAEKRVRAQIQQEQKAAAENARTTNAPKTPAPTKAGAAGSATRITSMADADNEFAAGRISLADYKKFRQQYGLKL